MVNQPSTEVLRNVGMHAHTLEYTVNASLKMVYRGLSQLKATLFCSVSIVFSTELT